MSNKTVTIRNKTYEVAKLGYNEVIQLAKYVNGLALNSNGCLTPELDRAAAYALTKIIPKIDPVLVNTETGIDLDFATEFYPLYKQLEKLFTEKEEIIDVPVNEETKEMKKARLTQELALLEGE